jgi:hypothetical protein
MNTFRLSTTIQLFVFCIISLLTSLSLDAQGLQLVQLSGFKAESRNGNVNLSWKTSSEENLRQFEVEYSDDGKYYHNLGFIPARNNLNGNFYEFEYPVSYNDSAFFRLKVVDKNGKWLYTNPVVYYVNNHTPFFVNPSVINTGVINVYLDDPFSLLKVVSMNGTVMLKQNLSGKTGRISIPVSPAVSSGIYIVQLKNDNRVITQKVFIR